MEENFRFVLIIISAVVIAAIFLHGFWTIRKQKNPYKLKANKLPSDSATEEANSENARGFDGKGFDQDGVSKARVVSVNKVNKPEPLFTSTATEELHAQNSAEYSADTLEHYMNEPHIEEQLTQPQDDLEPNYQESYASLETTPLGTSSQNTSLHDTTGNVISEEERAMTETLSNEQNSFFPEESSAVAPVTEPTLTPSESEKTLAEETHQPVFQEPLYEEPVTNAKPKRERKVSASAQRKKHTELDTSSLKSTKKDQLEIDFDNAHDIDDEDLPSMSATEQPAEMKKPELEPEVLIVSVVMPEGEVITGAALLPTLLTLGMKYGDMDIFHRHQDNAGNGKVTFSLANMMNPGSFDLDEMESMQTQGVSLFMTLPNSGDPFDVFEQMFSAAKQLAVEFKGQVLDDKRSVMTKQTVQHYIGKIRNFERKSRISG